MIITASHDAPTDNRSSFEQDMYVCMAYRRSGDNTGDQALQPPDLIQLTLKSSDA